MEQTIDSRQYAVGNESVCSMQSAVGKKLPIANCLLVVVFYLLPFTLCFAYAAAAEEESIICQADKIEYSEDGKQAIASGNVRVSYKDIKLTGDRLEINTETKDTHCYGNVVLTEEENRLIG